MASSMLRGSKVLWWMTPPLAGVAYHMTTLKAADNPQRKLDPKDLEIYDKPVKESMKPDEDIQPTALEEQISKGRKFVWKHSDKVKNVTDSSTEGAKTFWDKTKEFATNIQTDRTLQLKTGAITVASVTGILMVGRGRRPLRRVFFAGTLGAATAAVCYPAKASSVIKSGYNRFTSIMTDSKSDSTRAKVKFDDNVDQFRSGETLMLEEAFILGEMVYEELQKKIHGDEIHLPDVMAICHEVVREVFLGISEDFEIQTGGYVGADRPRTEPTGTEPHAGSDVVLYAKDVTRRVVQEVLDSINEDIEIQTGGVVTGAPTIALDSTILAKEISIVVSNVLKRDIASEEADQQDYLFSSPTRLSAVVCEEYTKCVDAAIRAQVPTGKCHVIINSASLAAKTAAEIKVAIDGLKNSRSVVVSSSRPVNTSDSGKVVDEVASSLLAHIEQDISKSRGKDYAFSEASNIVRKASQEATKAIASDVQSSGAPVQGRRTRVVLDLAKKLGEEMIEAINEDIEIQTGSGLRRPSDGKPKPPREPPVIVSKEDASTLDGIMYSPMYVPGFDHIADAVIDEVSEALRGRGVIIHELDHLAHVTMKEILDGVSEDIEIQTGGWAGREHKPHAVLSGKELVRRVANEVLQAIEEDMNIQTGGKLERKRDLYFDSRRLAKNIVDSVMSDVERDTKEPETSSPYLFSVPEDLAKLALKKLQDDIDQAAIGIGRNVGQVHVDVDALSEEVGQQLKERIEEFYIRANSIGDLRAREVAIVDFGEIRKRECVFEVIT
ncbi:uncharacterized protein LOC114527695 [Dendronephthya gigantea]|uniref:uncharacterized protein LOC114527695 n=1 Tax=Dendronephthya gigantea TaxID=151771 RepID=UPI0010692318|nr:uncharacterized protein LOC114527695 [Dendronephthya gigantea]